MEKQQKYLHVTCTTPTSDPDFDIRTYEFVHFKSIRALGLQYESSRFMRCNCNKSFKVISTYDSPESKNPHKLEHFLCDVCV